MVTPKLEDEAEEYVEQYLKGRIADTFEQLHKINTGEVETGGVVKQEAVDHFNRGIDLLVAGSDSACEYHAFVNGDGKIVYGLDEKIF